MINVLGSCISSDSTPYTIDLETKKLEKTNLFLTDPENVKLALKGNERDFSYTPKSTASFKASHGQIEDSSFKSIGGMRIQMPKAVQFNEDPWGEKITDSNDHLPLESLEESHYHDNGHSQRNEKILSKLVNVINVGDNPLLIFEELARLLEDKNKKSVLLTSLYKDYRFLIELAYNRGLMVSYILTDLMVNFEMDLIKSNKSVKNISPKSIVSITERKSHYKQNSSDSYYSKIFMEMAKKGKKSIQCIATIYPIFSDDKPFFKELSKLEPTDKKIVRRLLKALFMGGFPQNIAQMESVKEELQDLHEKFKVSDITHCMIARGYHLTKRKCEDAQFDNHEIKIENNSEESFVNWKDWSDYQIANALTARDFNFIKILNLGEIKNWLQNPSFVSPSREALQSLFDTTVNWVAFQIVSELKQENREVAINRFINIGTSLLNKRSYHSAAQIALALKLPAVDRFLTVSQRTNPNYMQLIQFSDLENLHEQYFHGSEFKYNLALPITEVFWKKLKCEFEGIKLRSNMLSYKDFTEVAKFVNHLAVFRWSEIESSAKNDVKGFTELLSNLDGPTAAEINEWSDYSYAVQSQLPLVDLKKPLSEWSVGNFLPFLAGKAQDFTWIDRMFSYGVWNGQSFIDVFSQNKNIIEDWPGEIKETIWMKYLEHLSQPCE